MTLLFAVSYLEVTRGEGCCAVCTCISSSNFNCWSLVARGVELARLGSWRESWGFWKNGKSGEVIASYLASCSYKKLNNQITPNGSTR